MIYTTNRSIWVNRGHEPLRKGISHEGIPPNLAVAKNLGFTPLHPLGSPIILLNPEFLATSLCHNRYPREKRGMASRRNRLATTGNANTPERYQSIGALKLGTPERGIMNP
jgi:hypothetical protein